MKTILLLLCIASMLLAVPALAEVPDTLSPRQFPEPVERIPFDSLLGYTVLYDESKIQITPAERMDEADVYLPIDEAIDGTSLTIVWQAGEDRTQEDVVAALDAALEEEGYTVIPFDSGSLFTEAFEAEGLSGLAGDQVVEAFVLKAEDGWYMLTVRYDIEGEEPYSRRLYGIVESFAITAAQEDGA